MIALVFGSLWLVLLQPPFGQDLNYHDFADRRSFSGIPNFLDVASSLPFAFIGIAGLRLCLSKELGGMRLAWLCLFVGVTFVSAGSAYYHWRPDNSTLVWDRLPMTVGFMGLMIAILGEYLHPRLGKVLLAPALLLGFWSVFHWHWFDDLRLYAWVQFSPVLVIPAVMVLLRRRYSGQWLLLVALGCYLLAKLAEAFDREVFALTQNLLSGHSLKHLLAALGGLVILWMLKYRSAVDS